jgi:hypothetical protein
MLSVIVLNVVMLSVVAPLFFDNDAAENELERLTPASYLWQV